MDSEKSDDKFTIIVDTREQTPWKFRASKYCDGAVVKKVDHGDYSLQGLEHLIFIERKASPAEIANNLIGKRFFNLLLKSEKYKYRYIICEFPLSKVLNYPHGCGLPKSVVKKIRVSGAFIISKLIEIQIEHGVQIIFCDNANHAQKFTLALFKKIFKRENP